MTKALEESHQIKIPEFAGRDDYMHRLYSVSYKEDGLWKKKKFVEYEAAYQFYVNYLLKLRGKNR